MAINKHNLHSTVALLNPLSNHNEGGRRTMGEAFTIQGVPIKTAEVQRVISPYGKKIIQESTEFVVAKGEGSVVGTYEIFGDTFMLVKYDEYQQLEIVDVENRREGFSPYTTHKKEGDKFHVGETLSYTESTVEGLPKTGKNVEVAFMMKGTNFEDAFTVSKKFSEEFTHKTTKVVDILVNSNSFLLNLFGTDNEYRPFPEHSTHPDNQILCCSRQIDTRDFISSLHKDKLDSLKFTDLENIIYGKGNIISIDVIRNNESEVDKSTIFEQGSKFEEYMDTTETQTLEKMKDFINTIVDIGYSVSPELQKKIDFFNSILNDKTTLLFKNNKFTGWFVRVKLEYESPLKVGSKIANLHGTKGLVSKIEENDNMPRKADGTMFDIYVNPNTMIGRMNLAQIREIMINKIADYFFAEIKKTDDLEERNRLYHKFSEELQLRKIEHIKFPNSFFEDIISTGYLHVMTEIDETVDLVSLMKKYNIEIMDDVFDSEGNKIEGKCLYGSNYYLKLKHEPEKKSSVATFGKSNEKDFLVKSSDLKKNKSLFGNVASKIGEMELTVLLVLPKGDVIKELITVRGGAKNLREKFSKRQLTHETISLEDFEFEKHIALESIEFCLKVVGVDLEPYKGDNMNG